MNLSAAYSDPFAYASSVQQQRTQQEVATAVALKQRDVQKAQGQAALQLLDAAKGVTNNPGTMPGFAPDKGKQVDYYA